MTGTRPKGALGIWCLGPGGYCVTWVLCFAGPWPHGPNPGLALVLVQLHAVAGIAVLFAFCSSPAWRRSLAAWTLLAYLAWWAVFGAIVFARLGDETHLPAWLPGFGSWTFHGTLVLALASGIGLLVGSRRVSASAPPPAPR